MDSKTGRVVSWVSAAVITCGLLYSIAVLTVQPAYAAACTPSECSQIEQHEEGICTLGHHGPLIYFQCPTETGGDDWLGQCEDGTYVDGSC